MDDKILKRIEEEIEEFVDHKKYFLKKSPLDISTDSFIRGNITGLERAKQIIEEAKR